MDSMTTSNFPAASAGAVAAKVPLIIRFYDYDTQGKDFKGRTLEEILSWSDSQLESCHDYVQMLFPIPEGSVFNNSAPVIDREVMLAFRSRSELRNRLRKSFERMLEFYGFKVSIKSEDELKKEQDEKEAAELKAVADVDPMIAAASNVLEQKNVDTGHSTAETRAASEVTITDATKDPKASRSSSSFLPGVHSNFSPGSMPYHVVRAPKWRKHFRIWAVRFDHNHLRITRILRCLRILGLQTECDAFFIALQRVYNDPAINISNRSVEFWELAVERPLHYAPDGSKCSWLRKWEDEQELATKTGGLKKETPPDPLLDATRRRKSVSFEDRTKPADDEL
ncbi:hypothetical protein EJ02DRAFT_449685 [Clathrospora elynae]|uniref:Opioid growth factor receptor (OGFr) conserved domain-containing protein n=1 Tax=Clathrospora elynae TaxID=706981 RepID=A0A6A5T9T9_9PLEO|nr:hypothetical protein EJ02DRAFT_449685 [Clathrospora elynae]